jgi:hypothetical protein
MESECLKKAQGYLTVNDKVILGIETLLKKHTKDMVIQFLQDLRDEKLDMLKDLITLDKTNDQLDITVAEWFRITMALNILREEVKYDSSKIKQRAESSLRGA